MTIDLFVEYNFAPIIGLIFQLIFLLYGKTFNKREKIVFFVSLALQSIEIISYNLELYCALLDHWNIWRVIFSIAGYIIRPALIYPFVYLLRKESKTKWSKLVYLDLIPLAACIIVQQLAYFTKLVFYFSEDNIFHRGPLGYFSMAVTIFYLIEAGTQIVLTKVLNKKFNVGLIIVILSYVVLAMLFESIFDIKSLGINAGIFSIVFFMFSLQTNNLNEATEKMKVLSEVDSLSQLSNRYSGEKQIDNLVAKRTAGSFMVLDIDNFKSINDTYGHAIGDEAIVKLAEALKNTFDKKDVIMRLGGDEFAIFSEKDLNKEDLLKQLFDHIDEIRLSCDKDFRMSASVGIANFNGEEETSFDKLYREADIKLYEAKKNKGNKRLKKCS